MSIYRTKLSTALRRLNSIPGLTVRNRIVNEGASNQRRELVFYDIAKPTPICAVQIDDVYDYDGNFFQNDIA